MFMISKFDVEEKVTDSAMMTQSRCAKEKPAGDPFKNSAGF